MDNTKSEATVFFKVGTSPSGTSNENGPSGSGNIELTTFKANLMAGSVAGLKAIRTHADLRILYPLSVSKGIKFIENLTLLLLLAGLAVGVFVDWKIGVVLVPVTLLILVLLRLLANSRLFPFGTEKDPLPLGSRISWDNLNIPELQKGQSVFVNACQSSDEISKFWIHAASMAFVEKGKHGERFTKHKWEEIIEPNETLELTYDHGMITGVFPEPEVPISCESGASLLDIPLFVIKNDFPKELAGAYAFKFMVAFRFKGDSLDTDPYYCLVDPIVKVTTGGPTLPA